MNKGSGAARARGRSRLGIYVCDADQIKSLLDRYESIEQICMDYNSTGGCTAALDANDGITLAFRKALREADLDLSRN